MVHLTVLFHYCVGCKYFDLSVIEITTNALHLDQEHQNKTNKKCVVVLNFVHFNYIFTQFEWKNIGLFIACRAVSNI